MKKIFSLIVCTLLLIINFSVLGGFTASADNAVIALSAPSIKVGENVVVTLKYTADGTISSLTGNLKYDSTVLEYVSGAVSAQNSVVFISDSTSTGAEKTYEITFKALKEGNSNLSLTLDTEKGTAKGTASAGAAVNVVNGDDLAGIDISGITLSAGQLTPAFSNDITEYTVTVPFSVEKITVSAQTADSRTRVTGATTYNLKVGNRVINLKTTLNGKSKTYKITATRLSAEETQKQTVMANTALTLNEKPYHIENDFTKITIPSFFTVATAKYNETDVNVAVDPNKQYTLFCLSADDGSETDWYYQDEENNFVKLQYINSNNNTYIIESSKIESGKVGTWFPTTIEINDNEVKAYKSTRADLKDIYIISCYVNGQSVFCRYDAVDKTVQRAPDFTITSQSEKEEIIFNKNFITGFKYLSNAGKVILTIAVLEAICLITLIVTICIRLLNRRKAIKQLAELGNENQQ